MSATEFNHKLLELQESLSYFARSLTANDEEAKDLVQDTNFKAITNRDKFQPDTNMKAWTYTIMKNTFINNYRKKKKANTIVDTTEDLYYMNTTKATRYESPDSSLAAEEIHRNIKSLDENQRMPFEMHNQGYKYKEIADHLDLSIGTVKSRIFFTRKKLMEKLQEFSN
ncbi:MAG: RNA polymerase sigma factor [Bacteroidales bacterium]|nr:RNA polymerase sigma factor [Bacteroidales bacterium]